MSSIPKRRVQVKSPDFPESVLSPEATRTRRNLVVATALWVLVIPLGITVTEIKWLGIEFSETTTSIEDLASGGLIFFWLSYSIYAFKDWAKWWHACSSLIDGKKAQIEKEKSETSSVRQHIETARKAGISDDAVIEITFIRGDHEERYSEKLEKWELLLQIYLENLDQFRKEIKPIRLDVYLRSAWDFVIPFSTILLSVGYWLCPVIFG